MKNLYALVGRNIAYSFSRAYFAEKFQREGLADCQYVNFDIQRIEELPALIAAHPHLRGFNVTIPYKRDILPLLSSIDPVAEAIGAVNTVKITPEGLAGYNTDAYGFAESLKPLLKPQHTHALILGTGGASQAVAYVLKSLGIAYRFVSRTPHLGQFAYTDLNGSLLKKYTLIINCTPLGTFPNTEACPPLPYQHLTEAHLLYDLIYNPEKTTFLQKGAAKGAHICNGQQMLELQAEAAWGIWRQP